MNKIRAKSALWQLAYNHALNYGFGDALNFRDKCICNLIETMRLYKTITPQEKTEMMVHLYKNKPSAILHPQIYWEAECNKSVDGDYFFDFSVRGFELRSQFILLLSEIDAPVKLNYLPNYKGYSISEDLTGYAPKNDRFSYFLDDGETYIGSGESVEDCKTQIDEIQQDPKEKISRFEYAILSVAAPEDLHKYEQPTREQELDYRKENILNQAKKINIDNQKK